MTAIDVEAAEAMSADVKPGGSGSLNVRSSWLALLVGAWLVGGLIVITWALNEGLTDDAGFSPYHIPAYLCLVALGASSLVLVGRAFRHGRPWREAFPQGFGSLGAGLVAILADRERPHMSRGQRSQRPSCTTRGTPSPSRSAS